MLSKIYSQNYPATQSQANSQPAYIQEHDNPFLSLFPHRYDFIWSPHVAPGESADWQTETRHPLSDRVIHQGSYLYGVRFGAQTQYALLDIDRGSPYHPAHDPFAIGRIVAALEPLGLVSYFACTSSYSGGLHLYFPLPTAQSSWQVAIAVATLLENSGFKLVPGQLEAFPNPKPYVVEGKSSLFNAHRLPLQTGSYLLNAELQPIWSTQTTFLEQWQFAQGRNAFDTKLVKQILKQARRKFFRISGKADKFVNDLNAEIELGWTGPGQTNRLLGRITMRSYIFHHVLSGGQPLQGQALIKDIVETAKSLPGYRDWCQHQHEIEQRAEEWARCIENSHYFHYGESTGRFKSKSEALEAAIDQAPTWNQQRSEQTRERIRSAIAHLLETGELPANATNRFKCLLTYKIGGGSLYRHRDLWHPNHLAKSVEDFMTTDEGSACTEGATEPSSLTSLFPSIDGNRSPYKESSDLEMENSELEGGNLLPEPDLSNCSANPPLTGIDRVRQMLAQVEARRDAQREADRVACQQYEQIQQEASDARVIERMQRYLDSNDPILMAEALSWARINPGRLKLQPTTPPTVEDSEPDPTSSRTRLA